ncbi:MAG: inositol monophosphatase [Chloroflexi bacterium]|nr:inositol monophosphatase [Chloroflexota bacterium]
MAKLRALQLRLRDHLRAQLLKGTAEELSEVAAARGGDTIYRIDERGEAVLLSFCREWAQEIPFRLVAEGLPNEGVVLPEGSRQTPRFRLIVDPIDGTRVIMYDKRSAWILAGVASEAPEAPPTLADIAVAMQTEVPTTRHYLGDLLYACRGEGTRGERHNLLTGEQQPFVPRPSRATTPAHGFASISKFFPGGKALFARLEEALFEEVLGQPADGNPLVFDDQYVSSGGQLYELIVGHDRFNADLRPLLPAGEGRGARRLCAHPYDLCTELVAREAGVIVTDDRGRPLSAPLNLQADVAWIGYANTALKSRIEPVLLPMLEAIREGRG